MNGDRGKEKLDEAYKKRSGPSRQAFDYLRSDASREKYMRQPKLPEYEQHVSRQIKKQMQNLKKQMQNLLETQKELIFIDNTQERNQKREHINKQREDIMDKYDEILQKYDKFVNRFSKQLDDKHLIEEKNLNRAKHLDLEWKQKRKPNRAKHLDYEQKREKEYLLYPMQDNLEKEQEWLLTEQRKWGDYQPKRVRQEHEQRLNQERLQREQRVYWESNEQYEQFRLNTPEILYIKQKAKQRWQEVTGETNKLGQVTKEILVEGFEHMIKAKSLNSEEVVLLGDILQGGTYNRVKEEQRDSEKYKRLMRSVYETYEYFNKHGSFPDIKEEEKSQQRIQE